MPKFIYARLAASNVKNNKKMTLPYILSSMVVVALFYIISSIRNNEDILSMRGGDATARLLTFGQVVIAFFITIFLFYTYLFLIKKRMKEMGLYAVLGITKNKIIKIISLETIYIALISSLSGLGLGILLDKLAYLFFIKLIDGEVKLGFKISFTAIITSIILFTIIYLLILIRSALKIKSLNIISLLKENQKAEREPKARLIFSVLAVCLLTYGYYTAVTIEPPLRALTNFFYAVLSVIIGTYLLFISLNILILKILKNNKKYYYKTKNFISISNLLFRMKRNAVGLANICILSTMVLVTLGSTSSLFFGKNDLISSSYPRDITLEIVNESKINSDQLIKDSLASVVNNNEKEKNKLTFTYFSVGGLKTPEGVDFDKTTYSESVSKSSYSKDAVFTIYVTLEDYNKNNGTNISLADNEILFKDPRNKTEKSSFKVNNLDYKVKAQADKVIQVASHIANVTDTYYIVVKDRQVLENIRQEVIKEIGQERANVVNIVTYYAFDLENPAKNEEKILAALTELSKKVNRHQYEFLEDTGDSWFYYSVSSKIENSREINNMMASFFFLGIMISAIFIISQIIIMYYKQISEGYDDKEKFKIMQQVGLDEREVKQSIKGQVLLVFFAPLLIATTHVIFAYPFIEKLLRLFSLNNTKVFLYAMLLTFLTFSIFYILVYKLTSRIYYNIIKKK